MKFLRFFFISISLGVYSSCSYEKIEGNFYLEESFFSNELNINDVEKTRCNFIKEIRFSNNVCLIKYHLLGVQMNLSSEFIFQDSIISFLNPQFSEYGFGFIERKEDGSLALGNCIFVAGLEDKEDKSVEEDLDSLINSGTKLEANSEKEFSTKIVEKVTSKPSPKIETVKLKSNPQPVVNQAVTTSAESKVEETVRKTPEQPEINERALMGAGGTKGTIEGKALMGNGSEKGINSDPGYSLDLAGWDFASTPFINDRVSTRNGRIVFKITVDDSGRVVQAVPSEYNVSEDVLAYYRQVVNQISFKKQGGAVADFSSGKITFIIKVD